LKVLTAIVRSRVPPVLPSVAAQLLRHVDLAPTLSIAVWLQRSLRLTDANGRRLGLVAAGFLMSSNIRFSALCFSQKLLNRFRIAEIASSSHPSLQRSPAATDLSGMFGEFCATVWHEILYRIWRPAP